MSLLNVVDIEATCWQGEPPPGQVSEIIEIGVCVLDLHTLERVEKRSLLVRPQRSEVSEFCTRLTTLTAGQVAGGLSFGDACAALRREFRTDSRPWASWGEYDRRQFQTQCRRAGVPYPFSVHHTNAKQRYAQGSGLRKMGLAGALQHARLPLEGTHHRGADDAWNIAALVVKMLREGHWQEPGSGAGFRPG